MLLVPVNNVWCLELFILVFNPKKALKKIFKNEAKDCRYWQICRHLFRVTHCSWTKLQISTQKIGKKKQCGKAVLHSYIIPMNLIIPKENLETFLSKFVVHHFKYDCIYPLPWKVKFYVFPPWQSSGPV